MLQQLAINKLSSKITILFENWRPWEGLNPILSVPTHCNQVKNSQATPLKTFPTPRIVQGKKLKNRTTKTVHIKKKYKKTSLHLKELMKSISHKKMSRG
jgi:hypothetical protein